MDSEERNRGMRGKGIPVSDQIMTEIEKEIQIHPSYADLQNQFGLLLAVKGDPDGAENHFLEALHLNPKYREPLLNLAYLHIEMNRCKYAEDILLSEIRKHPKDGFLRHVLGVLYFQTRRRKQAAFHLRKAVQYHPYCREYYQKTGVWKKGAVHFDQKSEKVLKRIPLNYHYAHFHNFIGLYLAKRGKSTQAVRELRKASRLKPDEFLFHANLGTVYYYQGSYQKAVDEYQQALKMDPLYGMGYANLSYIYGLMRRTREALRYMERAVRLNPRYADLRYNLALLYSDRKRYGEAISELKKALHINSNYLFARINLGVLYEDQRKWREARREYRKILRITPEDGYVRQRLERIS